MKKVKIVHLFNSICNLTFMNTTDFDIRLP